MIIFVGATLIMRLKVAKYAFSNFLSHEKSRDQEIDTLLHFLISWKKSIFADLMIKNTLDLLFRSHEIRPHDHFPSSGSQPFRAWLLPNQNLFALHSFTPFAYPAIKHPSLVQPYIWCFFCVSWSHLKLSAANPLWTACIPQVGNCCNRA